MGAFPTFTELLLMLNPGRDILSIGNKLIVRINNVWTLIPDGKACSLIYILFTLKSTQKVHPLFRIHGEVIIILAINLTLH